MEYGGLSLIVGLMGHPRNLAGWIGDLVLIVILSFWVKHRLLVPDPGHAALHSGATTRSATTTSNGMLVGVDQYINARVFSFSSFI